MLSPRSGTRPSLLFACLSLGFLSPEHVSSRCDMQGPYRACDSLINISLSHTPLPRASTLSLYSPSLHPSIHPPTHPPILCVCVCVCLCFCVSVSV